MTTNHAARVTYIGHATVRIEMDGLRVITDPMLRRRVMHLRNYSVGIGDTDEHRCDLALISHAHWDHLDLPSLRRLGRATPMIAPTGVGKLLRRNGFTAVHELAVGEEWRMGGLRVAAVPADHLGRRHPFGETLDCLGFVVQGRYSVYFAGDTDLYPAMNELAGQVDVALLPVWGWGPTLGPGHMTPRRAAEALTLIKPRAAIPIHWGTFYPLGLRRLLPNHLVKPPYIFAQYAQELAPETRICVLQPGEGVDLNQIAE